MSVYCTRVPYLRARVFLFFITHESICDNHCERITVERYSAILFLRQLQTLQAHGYVKPRRCNTYVRVTRGIRPGSARMTRRISRSLQRARARGRRSRVGDRRDFKARDFS